MRINERGESERTAFGVFPLVWLFYIMSNIEQAPPSFIHVRFANGSGAFFRSFLDVFFSFRIKFAWWEKSRAWFFFYLPGAILVRRLNKCHTLTPLQQMRSTYIHIMWMCIRFVIPSVCVLKVPALAMDRNDNEKTKKEKKAKASKWETVSKFLSFHFNSFWFGVVELGRCLICFIAILNCNWTLFFASSKPIHSYLEGLALLQN